MSSHRILVVEHEDWAGLGRLAEPLRQAVGEATIDVVAPWKGGVVPGDAAAEGYDALVVLGGSMAAWEDDVAPWLPMTRDLLRRAVEAGTPTLGICLGAQLLALATGGTVGRGDNALEVGLSDIATTQAAADDAVLGPVAAATGGRFSMAQWHQDAVSQLPPGAVLLASTAQYAHQAFRLGASAWGVQYHPEVTDADFGAWMAGGAPGVHAAGRDPEQVLAEVLAASASLDQVARLHAAAFGAVVHRADRADLAGR